jgi:hypothetical protein
MTTQAASTEHRAALPRRHPDAGPVRHDSRAWRAQVWITFGVAATLAASGLLVLPGTDIDRAFMLMGFAFSVSSAFALAKFVRDNEQRPVDSPLWRLVVWAGFAFAMGLTGWGLARMSINPSWKAYLIVCWLYLVSSVFTLAKTLRDAHEARLLEARLERSRDALEPDRDVDFDA